MEIILPHKWFDWTPIIDAFTQNGFVCNHNATNVSASYRNICVVLTRAIGPNGYMVHVKKYVKWITNSYSSQGLHLTIHFPELINELNHTANAMEFSKQESKAVEFKLQLYNSYLHSIIDNSLAVIRSGQGYADIKYHSENIYIQFNVKKCRSKAYFLDNDMDKLIGSITFKNKVYKEVNIKDCITSLKENVLVHVDERFRQEKEFRDLQVPIKRKMETDLEKIRYGYEETLRDILKNYTHIDPQAYTELLTKGINNVEY